MKPEIRYAEVRAEADGRTVAGVALPWNREGRGPGGRRERFERGSIDLAGLDIALTVQHERAAPVARTGAGLALADEADGLMFRAELPETPRAEQALADVRAGLLRGASVEFVAVRETVAGGVRVIRQARLVGLSLVDTPAYPDAGIEARERLPEPAAADWWNAG